MTTLAARSDVSVVGRWWWTVDRWLLAALSLLMFAGALFAMAASPSVAERIGESSLGFLPRRLNPDYRRKLQCQPGFDAGGHC